MTDEPKLERRAKSAPIASLRCAKTEGALRSKWDALGKHWYHEIDVLRRAKNHQNIAASIGFVLSGVVAALVEYVLTDGSTGYIPIVAAVIAAVLTRGSFWLFVRRPVVPRRVVPSENGQDLDSEVRVVQRDQNVHGGQIAQAAQVVQGDQVGQIVQGNQVVQVVNAEQDVERDRVRTPRTVEELIDEVKGKTHLAAKDVSRRHQGQWMLVTGQLWDVSNDYGDLRMSVEANEDDLVFCEFNHMPWLDRLKTLNRGDVVTVLGQIENIQEMGVSLKSCELI